MTKDLEGFVKNLSILKKIKMINCNSLTHKLVAIISIALVIFVVVVISILVRVKTVEIQSQTSAEIGLLADLEAAHLSGHFTLMIEKCKIQAVHFQRAVETGVASREDADEMLRGLVEHDQYATSSWVAFKANKFDGKDEIFRDSERYGASGSYSSWYHSLSPEGLINESIGDFENGNWYQPLVDQEVPLFLDPYSYTLKSGKSLQFISIAYPIFCNSEFVGYTGIDIDVKYIQKIISNINFFNEDYASLLSPAGIYTIHPDTLRIGSPIKFEQYDEAALRNFKSGNKYKSVHYSNYTNKEVLDHFRPLKFKDLNQIWYLQISVPSEHVENYLSTYITNLVVISVISALFVILLIYIVLYILLKPVTKISNNLKDLAQNGSRNAAALQRDSNDEIGDLVNSYNALLRSMVEKEELDREIIEARYHSDTALKLAKSGTFYIDVVNNPDKFFPSESTLDILGITLPEGISHLDFEKITRARIRTNSITGNNFVELLRKALNGEEENPDITYQATRADDQSIIWLRTVGKVIKNSAGEVTSVLGVVQNITEQKHSEEALIAKEENFRNLFEQSVDAILIFRPENIEMIDCNCVAINLFGEFSKAEFLQVKPCDVSPEFQSSGESSQSIIEFQIENAFINGSSIFEYEFQKKNGKVLNGLISMGRVIYNGEPVIQTNIKDITPQKLAEIEQELIIQKLKIAQETARVGSWYIDYQKNPEAIYMDESLRKIQGEIYEDFSTLPVWKTNLEETNGEVGKRIAQDALRRLNDPESGEWNSIYKYRRPSDNQIIWTKLKATFTRDSEGKVLYINGVSQDVTEHKLTEQKIHEVNQNLNMALKAASMGVWKYDFVKNRMETDANTLKLYELSENEVDESMEMWFSTLHKDDVNRVKELMKTTAEKQEKNYRATFRVKRKDGSYKHIISIGEFSYGEAGEPLLSNGLVWDISEIQEAQDNIQRVLDTVPVGVAIYDRSESELLFMSKTLRSIMEVEPNVGIGHASELSYVDVEQRDAVFSEFDRSGALYNREVQLFRNRSKVKFWANLTMLSFKYYDKETILITIQDITEMKALQMDIISTKEQAESANVAKSVFLANMSHEIRTPMNSILGFSEILYKRIKDPVSNDYIESIRTSGQTLMGLISDILDFSKIEAGRFELYIQPTDIHKSIQEISNIYSLQAKEKDLEFNTIIADSLPQFIVVDDLRLKQVLLNFLGNALKFTVEGSITIEVDCEVKSHSSCDITFSVSDTGIGISKEEHLHIFEAFRQQEQQDNRRYGGTGLGLSISNNLVGLMGSEIQLESDKGRGSCFHFTLCDIEIVSSEEFVEVPKLDQFDGNRVLFTNSHLLIVDDIASNQELIIDLLADRGLSCSGASSAVEAIEMVMQRPPNLIFMDIFMPEIDGYEAMNRIRKMDFMREVPIIAVTASYSKKESERAKAYGFDGFIAKPVNEMRLLENLVKFLPYTMIPETESEKYYALDFDIKGILANSRSVEKLQQECVALFMQFFKRQSSRVSSSLAMKLKEIGDQTDNAELEQLGSEFLCAIETFNIEKIGNFRQKLNQLFELLLK